MNRGGSQAFAWERRMVRLRGNGMTDFVSGALWFVMDVVLVAALAAGLVYGTIAWRKRPRNRSIEEARDNATRRLYDVPERR